jgi:glycosyltransferase involved in cell wall biosynthesis
MIREMVRAQVAAGDDVTLLANSVQSAEPWAPAGEYLRRIQADEFFSGIELIVARSYGRKRPWSRLAYSPESRRWLRERLRDSNRRPDIVHVHCIFSHVTALAAGVAREFCIPYVLSPHGALDSACYQSGRKWLKRLFVNLTVRRDLRCAASLHTTSEAEAHELQNWVPASRIKTVPLGATLPSFDFAATAEGFQKRFPQLRDRRIVLFLGRLASKKRPELLVAAVAQLKDEMPDAMLLFAGSDAGGMSAVQHAISRHSLADRVVFCGFLQGADKQGAFACSSVFALPSTDENFAVAVVEAMAHGVPALVTPGVASHVHVDAAGCGLTVDGHVDAIASGLRQLLNADRHQLGDRGRDYVARNLTWPAIVRQLNSLYEEAVNGKSLALTAGIQI